MTLSTKTNAARAFGSIAFASGAPAVPARDANLMALLAGMPIGKDGIKVMKAWVAGWTQACLAS